MAIRFYKAQIMLNIQFAVMMNLTAYGNIFWINPYITQKKTLKSSFAVLKFEEIKELSTFAEGGVLIGGIKFTLLKEKPLRR